MTNPTEPNNADKPIPCRVQEMGFFHSSSSDSLRRERRSGSVKLSQLIRSLLVVCIMRAFIVATICCVGVFACAGRITADEKPNESFVKAREHFQKGRYQEAAE